MGRWRAFWRGVGSVFDLCPDPPPPFRYKVPDFKEYPKTPEEVRRANAEAIGAVWASVGQDLRDAIGQFDRKLRERGQGNP